MRHYGHRLDAIFMSVGTCIAMFVEVLVLPRRKRPDHLFRHHLSHVGSLRLYDLIKIKDAALRPAFYFAVNNTLVADDLESASRIAYAKVGRWAPLQRCRCSRDLVSTAAAAPGTLQYQKTPRQFAGPKPCLAH